MYHVITPQRMQTMERAFMAESGTPGLVLMERAAQAVADAAARMTPHGVLFLCGPGNNGGDGYAAARLLMEAGHVVWVWALSDPERLSGDAQTNYARCVSIGIPIECLTEIPQHAPDGCGVIVDALFGTGLQRPLEGLYADAARWMNVCDLPVLAVDMPSGTSALMVQARETVAFHLKKPQHLLYPGRTNAGHVMVVDIGIPYDASPEDYSVLEPGDVTTLLPPRPRDAHKGMAGHALALAGSFGMAGAAALCANAALRGGAGLVTVCCATGIVPTVQGLAPCATCAPHERLRGMLSGKDAIAAGPGLGQTPEVGALLEALLEASVPQVWDADALNWLAAHPRPLSPLFVLTPHPGEAARLLDVSTREITADPLAAADALQQRYGGATVLLKGATTVIVDRNGRALNAFGTPGMATGGSGDVLTGLILALLAQGLAPFDAARLGAFLHGQAGEIAATQRGVRSMIAWDMLDTLRIE